MGMFESRIKKAQNSLGTNEIDALLITSVYNIAYLTGIFAFSIEEREARILITKSGHYLFTDARYTEMVKNQAPHIELIEINSNNPFLKSLKKILTKDKVHSLGFEEEHISYKEAADLEEKLDNIDFIPTQDIIEGFREVKDVLEIESVKKACALTDLAFSYILKEIRPGLTELEVKIKLENFILSKGEKLAFESIVAFGKNAAIPHHLSTNYPLQPNTCILLDFGAKVSGYCSDMTRTVFIGQPDSKFVAMYEATKKSQEIGLETAINHIKNSFQGKHIHENANRHIVDNNFPPIPHAIGHGVGLQVHELPWVSPYSDEKFPIGSVITVEPGIYIPGFAGVRIEDTVLITKTGAEVLTKSSKELIVL